MSTKTPPLRLGYLTGLYPKASHTFIEREVRALRGHGAEVVMASVRTPTRAEIIGPEEEAARAETFYLLAAAKNPVTLARAHLGLLARSPGRWLSTLALALRTA